MLPLDGDLQQCSREDQQPLRHTANLWGIQRGRGSPSRSRSFSYRTGIRHCRSDSCYATFNLQKFEGKVKQKLVITEGSIRIPASFNGVFGHEPTPGIISNVGQLPKVSKTIDQKFLTTGPICRYAEDLTLMMRLLVKPDLEAALALDTEVSVKDLKVYYMADNGGGIMETAVSKDVVQAQSKLVRMIGDSGLKVKQVAIEEVKHSGKLNASAT